MNFAADVHVTITDPGAPVGPTAPSLYLIGGNKSAINLCDIASVNLYCAMECISPEIGTNPAPRCYVRM